MSRLLPLVLLVACNQYHLHGKSDGNGNPDGSDTGSTSDVSDGICEAADPPVENVGGTDACGFSIGAFEPVVEWSYGKGESSRATVAVADLNGDGMPEIIANITAGGLGFGTGDLVALEGDGSGPLWTADARLGYASSPAVGDIDGDGLPDIIGVREYKSSMMAVGDYTVEAFDSAGSLIWESAHHPGADFDYASAPIVDDMDHDGSPEVIVGRVIFDNAGAERGVGEYGRGSYGITKFGGKEISEGTIPAVADLDLDGEEEVIVGDARYDVHGNAIWHDGKQDDAMIAIGNMDSDPEGEIVATTHDNVRLVDTDGTVVWQHTLTGANIASPAAIADLDGDGQPEIAIAGGSNLYALHADGSILWKEPVTDTSGASGPSIFDFDGDGIPEVVYADEIEINAYDGKTGTLKFHTEKHASDTMLDYPIIADVDNDGHAEIVVAHAGYSVALSVYGDATNSWAPARKVWNQHAYSITNIDDDLSVPTTAVQNFTRYNTWHAALGDGGPLAGDLSAEIFAVCTDDCDIGRLLVTGRILNYSSTDLPAGVSVALYAKKGGATTLLGVQVTTQVTPAETSGEALVFDVTSTDATTADSLWLVADDDGTGAGSVSECDETNNGFSWKGPFCSP